MSQLLTQVLNTLNGVRKRSLVFTIVIRVIRALLLAGIVLGLWSLVRPDQEEQQLLLMFLTFCLGMIFNFKRHSAEITHENLLISLEMKHPGTKSSPFRLKDKFPDTSVEREWLPILEGEIREYIVFERNRFFRTFSTLALPFIFFLVVTNASTIGIKTAFTKVKNVVAQLNSGATMKVIEGMTRDDQRGEIRLSGRRVLKVELLSENMIEIKYVGISINLFRKSDPSNNNANSA